MAEVVVLREVRGASGEDIVLEVPLGTVAKDAETGEVHFEIEKDGETKILVKVVAAAG